MEGATTTTSSSSSKKSSKSGNGGSRDLAGAYGGASQQLNQIVDAEVVGEAIGGQQSHRVGLRRRLWPFGREQAAAAAAVSDQQQQQQQQRRKNKNAIRDWNSPTAVRFLQIALLLGRLALLDKKASRLDKKGQGDEARAVRRLVATKAKTAMLKLGPTFIKLGQLLSTRVDLLNKDYIEGLSSLQDDVPAFDGRLAVAVVESQLKAPIGELFDSFDEEPLAAASLGQVHRAVLNGEQVVVKVQRQGLRGLFEKDLRILRFLAYLADFLDPSLDGTDRDWKGVYSENSRLLYREIDYEQEARNCDLFRRNFEGQPWIKVPVVQWDRVSSEVLTMEYVPGIKISDIEAIDEAGIDRKVLAKRSAESYMTQLTRHGFFHCDPHPGNLACDKEEGGRLIYYDFGMMDFIPERVRRGFVLLTFGVYENDPKDTCDGAEQMGILRTDVDRTSMEIVARSFLDEFAATLKGGEDTQWENELSAEEQLAIRKKRRTAIGSELFMVGEEKPFVFPASFTFVFRAFTTLDGIGKGLDEKYDVARLAQPYLREMADLKDGSVLKSLTKSWGKKLGWRPRDVAAVVQQPRRVEKMDAMLTEMEEGRLKLRVRALEVEQAVAKLDVETKITTTIVALTASVNAALLLLLLPTPVATAGVAQLFSWRQLCGRALLLNAIVTGAWRLPRLLLRQKRVRVGAFEPGQLKI